MTLVAVELNAPDSRDERPVARHHYKPAHCGVLIETQSLHNVAEFARIQPLSLVF
jgi:hypothetical protein